MHDLYGVVNAQTLSTPSRVMSNLAGDVVAHRGSTGLTLGDNPEDICDEDA